jgi:hypothetical protein
MFKQIYQSEALSSLVLLACALAPTLQEARADKVTLIREPVTGEVELHDLPAGSEFVFNADVPAEIATRTANDQTVRIRFSTDGKPGASAGTRARLNPGARLASDGATNVLELSGGGRVHLSCIVEWGFRQEWEVEVPSPPVRKPCEKDPYAYGDMPCRGKLEETPPKKVQREQWVGGSHRCTLDHFLLAVGNQVAVQPAEPPVPAAPRIDTSSAARLDEGQALHDLPPGTRFLFVKRTRVDGGLRLFNEGEVWATIEVEFQAPKLGEERKADTQIEAGSLLTLRTGRVAGHPGLPLYKASELTTFSDTVPRITCRRTWVHALSDLKDREGWPTKYEQGSNPCTLKAFLDGAHGGVIALPPAR